MRKASLQSNINKALKNISQRKKQNVYTNKQEARVGLSGNEIRKERVATARMAAQELLIKIKKQGGLK